VQTLSVLEVANNDKHKLYIELTDKYVVKSAKNKAKIIL